MTKIIRSIQGFHFILFEQDIIQIEQTQNNFWKLDTNPAF
jgi:hypothetical protein